MSNSIVVTRVLNYDLYERMKQSYSLPFEMKKYEGYKGGSGSVNYLIDCLQQSEKYDWIINIDEDCLILNNQLILDILEYMKLNDIDFCGMSDGGICETRFHNPIATNPFFNIFSKKFATTILNSDRNKLINTKMSEDLKRFAPKIINKNYSFDNFEPFYCIFFFALNAKLKPLYLEAEEYDDKISTKLKFSNKSFIIHTWYARTYNNNEKTKKRIDDVFTKFKENQL